MNNYTFILRKILFLILSTFETLVILIAMNWWSRRLAEVACSSYKSPNFQVPRFSHVNCQMEMVLVRPYMLGRRHWNSTGFITWWSVFFKELYIIFNALPALKFDVSISKDDADANVKTLERCILSESLNEWPRHIAFEVSRSDNLCDSTIVKYNLTKNKCVEKAGKMPLTCIPDALTVALEKAVFVRFW